MATRFYPAIIEGVPGGDSFSVFFPDLPGCTTVGRSEQHAAEQAAEALAVHLEGMLEDGNDIPPPSPLNAPLPAWAAEAAGTEVARALVPYDVPGKAMRVNITMDEALLKRVDTAANKTGNTRSGYIAAAVREHFLTSYLSVHGPAGSFDLMKFNDGSWAVFSALGGAGEVLHALAMEDSRGGALAVARRLAGLESVAAE